jgi:hypothetical protein
LVEIFPPGVGSGCFGHGLGCYGGVCGWLSYALKLFKAKIKLKI